MKTLHTPLKINNNIILTLEKPDTWLKRCWNIIKKNLPSNLYNQLYEVNNIYDFLCENQENPIKYLKEPFFNSFRYLKTYHATKITSIDSFLVEGIKPLDITSSNNWIINFFTTHNLEPSIDIKIIHEIIQKNIDHNNDSTRKNLTYFQAYKDQLLTCSTQYLFYGSERALCIFNKIEPKGHYGKYLLKLGIPTIFHVALPTNQITNIDSVLLKIFSSTASYFINSETDYGDDLSITTSNILTPEHILKYEHPDINMLKNYIHR